jgi:hypothetical protein
MLCLCAATTYGILLVARRCSSKSTCRSIAAKRCKGRRTRWPGSLPMGMAPLPKLLLLLTGLPAVLLESCAAAALRGVHLRRGSWRPWMFIKDDLHGRLPEQGAGLSLLLSMLCALDRTRSGGVLQAGPLSQVRNRSTKRG